MNSFARRLRAALLPHGKGDAEHLAALGGFSVQTARAWLKMEDCNVFAPALCKVANQLGVRATWLALGTGEITRLKNMHDAQKRLLELYDKMPEHRVAQWIAYGGGLRDATLPGMSPPAAQLTKGGR